MNYAVNFGPDPTRIATETLSILGLPACAIDSAGRVLAANDLFEELTPRVATCSRGLVYVANKSANGLLYQSVERLNSPRTAKAIATIPIPAAETLPALILHLVSIKRSARDIFRGASALMVATVLPERRFSPPVALVAGLFDLTGAEARVAKGILEGKPLNRLAGELGLSTATVRSYLKSVFAKTGVHRQAEFVSLLAGVLALIR
jgi:DNA-binding CsgD family transcriptional regulator